MRLVKTTAEKILRPIPDYGKASPEYLMGIMETIAAYPVEFHAGFANPVNGVATRTNGFLPSPAHFAEVAKELQVELDRKRRLDDMDARFKRTALAASDGPYQPKQRERYFDTRGEEITPRVAAERLEQHKREVASMKKVERHSAYARELGNGDYLAGMMVMMERGIVEPPQDWSPQ
jgi:hypothetical protein